VLSTMQVLESTLGLLAMQSPLENQYRPRNKKRARREKEKGWETVLRVLTGVKGVEDW